MTRERNTSEPEEHSSHAESVLLQDPAYLRDLQTKMQQFAQIQLNDHQLAEDAVQEALIGAMKNAKSFGGRSAFRTWVFAILKNKIADTLRKRHRSVEITNLSTSSQGEDEVFSNLFNESGHWEKGLGPSTWGDPEQSFKHDQFWQVLEACLENLPERQAKIFMMREYIGLNSDEICEQEDLSVSNLHVTLYRARMRLQKCLEVKWFGKESEYA